MTLWSWLAVTCHEIPSTNAAWNRSYTHHETCSNLMQRMVSQAFEPSYTTSCPQPFAQNSAANQLFTCHSWHSNSVEGTTLRGISFHKGDEKEVMKQKFENNQHCIEDTARLTTHVVVAPGKLDGVPSVPLTGCARTMHGLTSMQSKPC